MAITDLELGPGFQLSKYQLGPAQKSHLTPRPGIKVKIRSVGGKDVVRKSFFCLSTVCLKQSFN